MRLPALLLAALLLAGCSDPDPPSMPDAQAPADPARPWAVELGPCLHWHAIVDAPAATFPGGTPYHALPGTAPGTVRLRADGVYCGSASAELWEGWPVAEGGVLPRLVLASNETRAGRYAAAGLPAEDASMQGFYSLRAPGANHDGVGRSDGSHVLSMEAYSTVPGEAPAPATFLLPAGNGTVSWSASGGANLQAGPARVGDTTIVGPSMVGHWRGEGVRQEGATVRVAWGPDA